MNIHEFNNSIEEVGKRLFGDRYSFSSSHVQSIMYGHTDEKVVTYRGVIFYDNSKGSLDAESTDINAVCRILETKYYKLQSGIEL